jgi:Fic family protein
VGYAWIRDQLDLPPLLLTGEARVAQVASLQRLPEGVILVPQRMAPAARWLDQLLFALKHEGVDLYHLSHALRQVEATDLIAQLVQTPNGVFLRKACWLWEQVHQRTLDLPPGLKVGAAYAPFFEPDCYVCGPVQRSPKWRIDFNGLGDLRYCPVVRLTPAIQALQALDLLGQARQFAAQTPHEMLDRALGWAYLSETEGSYAIEGEVPTPTKASAFVKLLRHAHDPQPLSEERLVTLQNLILTNPLDMAVQFRTEQNRLQSAGRGAVGVTYVPPAPELAYTLMAQLIALANRPLAGEDALIRAAVVSFGFVYIHPFMDGNGRLSRFLLHHCLGQSGQLPPGFVLPLSVAMKRHEADYLAALTSFSRPARELCHVTWLGDDRYTYDWIADADVAFRYPDLTACVEFTLRMAQAALQQDLQHEAQFLADFDRVFHAINAHYDLRSSDLSTLILCAFEQGGVLTKTRRKRYADRVPVATLDAIEAEVQHCLADRSSAD